MDHLPPFFLPRITNISLESFDLYKVDSNPTVEFDRSVLCLVGANGLGKSTFLNTANYAITGAIPDPLRQYKSPEEYLANASRPDRIDQYFTGRISELSRDIASATVTLQWADQKVCVTRDLFNDHSISKLILTNGDGEFKFNRSSSTSPDDEYKRCILRLTRLPSFDRFVFLFHFVLTFDEGRHLISWDDRAITDSLYLAFGAHGDTTKSAKLTREMERASSRARNTRFMAKAVTDRIKHLQGLLDDTSDSADNEPELLAERDALELAQSEAESRVDELDRDRQAADLKWAEVSARISDLQSQYRQVFSARASKSSSVGFHPTVRVSVEEDCCAICHTSGVASLISAHLAEGRCPLCASQLAAFEGEEESLASLKQIDADLAKLRNELEAVLAERSRLEASRNAAAESAAAATAHLESFLESEQDNLEIDRLRGREWLAVEIRKQIEERGRLLKQASAHRENRDKIRLELRQLEKQLQSGFDAASKVFAPRFRELAQEFIGLPIDVALEQRTGVENAGFRLKLTIDDQLRSSAQRLSESQRFFVDIALRMALAESITAGPATLLIDTPEGSLDIAYEAKAGQLFNKFCEANNYILMTANLRSSALLKNLATLSGQSGMRLVRMTEWTQLTEVQSDEEARLDEAYDEIVEALR